MALYLNGKDRGKIFIACLTAVPYSGPTVKISTDNASPLITPNRAAERITNEANALKLVRQKTEILVPRVIKHGTHPDGTRYLVTELIDGIMLNGVHRESCFLPQGEEKHTTETPCHTCVDRAYSNAVDYIEKIVQPQLENIRYYERGLEGLVMPPQWLAIDVDPLWKGIKGQFKILRQDNSDYVFQHGDLSDRNIIIDKETLQVMALIDWEYAGTFLKAWITGRGRWMKTCVVPELMFRL